MSIPTEYAPVRRLLNTVHSFLGPLTFPPCARDDAHTRPRFFLVSQSLADTPITILHSYFCVRLCMIDVDTLAPRGFPHVPPTPTVQPTGRSTVLRGPALDPAHSEPRANPHSDIRICSLSLHNRFSHETHGLRRAGTQSTCLAQSQTLRVQRGRVHSQCSQPNTEGAARGAALDGIFLEERARDY
jgi:hypothetical protein